jgi:hypothetical protein
VNKAKRLLFVLAFFGTGAVAEVVPFVPADGKYSMRCQMFDAATFDQVEGGLPDSLKKRTGPDGVTRDSSEAIGTAIYLTVGDITHLKQALRERSSDYVRNTELTRTFSRKRISENQFEEVSSFTSTSEIDGRKNSVSGSFKRLFAVYDNFEVSLRVNIGQPDEAVGRGEIVTTKHEDGSFTRTYYIRDGFRQDRRQLEGGSYTLGKFVHQMTWTCTYKPM